MDFGKPLRKRKSEIKYETFCCSEIQLQRLMADKLPCYHFYDSSSEKNTNADLKISLYDCVHIKTIP